MAGKLSPFVYWGQNNDRIFLKVDLSDVDTPKVDLQDEVLRFEAHGQGVRGLNNYAFEIEFYLPIEAESSSYKVSGRYIEFRIQKVGIGEVWPRLMVQQKKPAWLKIDFDHFAFEDDSDDNAPNSDLLSTQEEDVMKRLEKELEDTKSEAAVDLKMSYLFLYNMFQWIGYSYVFFYMCYRYFKYGEASKRDTFEAVSSQLMLCQVVAIMEIVHPLLGWVRTDVSLPLMQVLGRNMVLFMLIGQEPHIQNRDIVWWLFGTWTVVEVIRYPFYMLNTIKMEWRVVTWLRYTAWIPLYPMGFTCEGITMLLALPYFERSGRWTVGLPNSWNVAFHFPTFLRMYMVGFLIAMYILMKRMYEQRKKKIKPSKSAPRKLQQKKTKTS